MELWFLGFIHSILISIHFLKSLVALKGLQEDLLIYAWHLVSNRNKIRKNTWNLHITPKVKMLKNSEHYDIYTTGNNSIQKPNSQRIFIRRAVASFL